MEVELAEKDGSIKVDKNRIDQLIGEIESLSVITKQKESIKN